MPQQSASLNWVVSLVVVLVVIGAALGLTLSGTNLLNFNTSAADMRARDQATLAQAARAEIDQQVYQAQKQSELAAIAANARAQADKAALDQQAYRVQQTVEAMDKIAAAKQQAARLLTQSEVERQSRLAQVEIQREQQLAQIRASEQQRAEQAVLTVTLAVMLVLVTVVIAIGGLGLVIVWLRLRRAPRKSAIAASDAQANAKQTSPPAVNQRPNREYWQKKIDEARANEMALRSKQYPMNFPPDSAPSRYHDLPLAG